MDLKYLERWIESPIPGRRQKAIYRLAKLAIYGRYSREKLFDKLADLLKDKAWQVRATTISAVTNIAESILPPQELIDLLVKIAMEDKHPNVRANAMIALGKIYETYAQKGSLNLDRAVIIKLVEANIKEENNDIKHAVMYLAGKLGVNNFDSVKTIFETLLGEYSRFPALLRKELLSILRRIYIHGSENAKDIFLKTLEFYRSDDVYYVVEEILHNIAVALDRGIIEISDDIKDYIKKKLQLNNKTPVIIAALSVLERMFEKDNSILDEYLDIVINELLLKTKNKAVKIRILEFLEKNIGKIPSEIIYKYGLPRVLDKIDMITVPKSKELATIKGLARRILEDKLGYNFELRQKLRES